MKLDKAIKRMEDSYPDLLKGVIEYWKADMHTRYVYQKCKPQDVRGRIKMTAANELQMREKIRRDQGGVCPICKGTLERQVKGVKADPIDHDHTNHLIRAIIHPRCNTVEGSIIMNACRALGKDWKDPDVAVEVRNLLIEKLSTPVD